MVCRKPSQAGSGGGWAEVVAEVVGVAVAEVAEVVVGKTTILTASSVLSEKTKRAVFSGIYGHDNESISKNHFGNTAAHIVQRLYLCPRSSMGRTHGSV